MYVGLSSNNFKPTVRWWYSENLTMVPPNNPLLQDFEAGEYLVSITIVYPRDLILDQVTTADSVSYRLVMDTMDPTDPDYSLPVHRVSVLDRTLYLTELEDDYAYETYESVVTVSKDGGVFLMDTPPSPATVRVNMQRIG